MCTSSKERVLLTNLFITGFLLLCTSLNVSSQESTTDVTYESLTPKTNAQAINSLLNKNITTSPIDNSYRISGTDLLTGPSKDDIAAHMALMIWGEPIKTIMDTRFNGMNASAPTGSITLVSHLATITASLALFFTSLMMLQGIASGLIYTGRDGELLGKEWDHKLFPLRATWHTAFLVPWPGFGGLAGIQVFILFLGLLGLGIAGITFKSGVKFIASGGQAVLYQDTQMLNLAGNVIDAAMCDSFAKAFKLSASPDKDFYPVHGMSEVIIKRVNVPQLPGSVSVKPNKSDGIELLVGNRQCGSFHIPYIDDNATSVKTTATIVKKAVYVALEPAIRLLFDSVQTALASNNEQGFIFELINDFDSADLSADEALAIENARIKFNQTIIDSFNNKSIRNELMKANEDFIEETSKFGFAFFFKYYYELNARQELTSNAVSSVIGGEAIAPWDLEVCTGWFDFLCSEQKQIGNVKLKVDDAFLTLYRLTNVMYERTTAGLTRTNAFSEDDFNDWIVTSAQVLTTLPRTLAGIENPDPIIEVKALGDMMNLMAEGMFLASARAKAVVDGAHATAPFGLSGITGGIASYVSSLFSKLILTLIPVVGLAFVYSSIIPAIPILYGFVAVISFFIYWTIAVYHSPFWYAMGAMPKGDGLIGRAGTGYSMSINLLLMPSFMVVGFLTGMTLMKVFGWFVNIAFFDAMASMSDASGIFTNFSFIKLVGILVVYGTIYTVIIWKCFGLVFEIPNTLSQWMGTGNKTDFGEGEAKGSVMASSTVAAQSVKEGVTKIGRQGDNREAQLNNEANAEVPGGDNTPQSPANGNRMPDTPQSPADGNRLAGMQNVAADRANN
jgi:conjugal transfer/type IV secretion protein DotA/TraY